MTQTGNILCMIELGNTILQSPFRLPVFYNPADNMDKPGTFQPDIDIIRKTEIRPIRKGIIRNILFLLTSVENKWQISKKLPDMMEEVNATSIRQMKCRENCII